MYTIAATQAIQQKKALLASRPFGEESAPRIGDLVALAMAKGVRHPFLSGVETPGTAILVINSDRGLCGRYVSDLNSAAERLAAEKNQVKLLLGGDKAWRYFRRRPWPIAASYIHAYERPSLAMARRIQSDLLGLYGKEVGEVYAVYMYFRGELVQRLRVEQLLPIEFLDLKKPRGVDPILEPELPKLLDQALSLHLLSRLYLILVEGKTSEHAIRRQAMRAATDNADELLEKLTLRYNKARQQAITSELSDIMGGVEALREAE
jgi:F-type H+-transporting ATPase subunit gamma